MTDATAGGVRRGECPLDIRLILLTLRDRRIDAYGELTRRYRD